MLVSVERSCNVREIFALFRNLDALILDWNTVKDIRVTEIAKGIQFKGFWSQAS